nr:MAG TPA: hypothetical protein [Caudoviricetes sp.]
MGKVIPMLGGGGGADLDVITATAADVRAGKVIVDKEGNPVAGVEPERGNWTGNVAMNGKITIPDGHHGGGGYVNGPAVTQRGAVSAALNCGGSYTILEGYHNGAGKITANSLSSQTGGVTAVDDKVISGYTYWRDGIKRTGNLTIQSIVNFNAALYSTRAIMLTWQNPGRGPFSGVRIICRTDGRYPDINNAGDGTLCYEGSGNNILVSNLPANSGVWFRAFPYITTSIGRLYDPYTGGRPTTYAVASSIQGQQIFTSSGTFMVPALVREVQVFLVGAGGGGNYRVLPSGSTYYGGGGGGGGYTRTYKIATTPGQQIAVNIGASNNSYYGDGGTTYFGSYSALGGHAHGKEIANGSDGGSGGGAGSRTMGGSGGIDGGDGAFGGGQIPGGKGQGSTTRAFGDASGTLYASGGSGGDSSGAGTGGGENTGNGGGGMGNRSSSSYGKGGSGICIVRWGGY